jgi:GNAT superfamily N-acetyltransferase
VARVDRNPEGVIGLPGYPGLALRAAGAGDFAFLEGLHAVLRRPAIEAAIGWDAAREAARLRATIRPGLDQVVLLGGQPVGIFAMTAEPHRLWLRRIQLLPPVQGRGIGTALLRFALAEGRRLGLPVFLRVRRGNRAQALYARLGFRITGEAPGDRLEMTAETG